MVDVRRHLKWILLLFLVGLLVFGAALPLIRSAERQDLDDEARSQASGQFAEFSHGLVHYQVAGRCRRVRDLSPVLWAASVNSGAPYPSRAAGERSWAAVTSGYGRLKKRPEIGNANCFRSRGKRLPISVHS